MFANPFNQATLLESFYALAASEGLKKGTREYRARRRAFLAKNVREGFANHFGEDACSLENWKRLLKTIGIEDSDDFTSINQCKKALRGKFVNLVDLVDAANAERTIVPPNPFPSRKALADYINETEGKVFPKDEAKGNHLLEQFLIVLTSGSWGFYDSAK
ncbi:hypothetical protein L218DRAFT_987975 [Marasmius fiardii PR-910]|nr:hypothetical protein L218DRAFT_987975 [Marasmius fiardii PR-910]